MSTEEEAPLDFRFDARVVGGYDDVRAHPPEVSAEIARSIVAEIGEGASVFEPGVGTGRIAVPLVEAGLHVLGADISGDMLSVLEQHPVSKSGRLELVKCDVGDPPFQDHRFDAVLCVHVLHLLRDYASALRRFLNMLRPGGYMLLGRDWVDPQSFAGEIRMTFRRTVVDTAETISMPPMARQFVEALVDAGATAVDDGEEKTAAEWQTQLTVRQLLDQIRTKDDPESWVLPDELLERVMEKLDQWADDTYAGQLDTPMDVTRRFVYSVLRAP